MNLKIKRLLRKYIVPFVQKEWIKLLVPTLIFVFTTFANIVEAKSYHQDVFSVNAIDPVTKTFILGEIDKYTPIIEERRDMDRINALESEGEFVVIKPTLVKTEFTQPDTPEYIQRTQNIIHIVQAGETLGAIGVKYQLKQDTLLAANQNLADGDSLKVGAKLLIPYQDYDPTYAAQLLDKKAAKFSRSTGATTISSRYSYGSSKVTSGSGCIKPANYSYVSRRLLRYHHGIDMVAPYGTPIYSACSGRIIAINSGWSGGFGLNVQIAQDNGDTSLYAHMSSFSKSIYVGQRVSAGTYLGGIGSTGRSTGSHLHFEVRRNGRAVDYGY